MRATERLFQNIAADDVQERLKEVNRSFTKIAIVTPFADVWANWPDATIIDAAETLDFPDSGYDLIIHALHLHWSNDLVGQMIQCRRVMQPDGLFLATLFGGQTLSELRTTLAEAEANVTGGLSPRIAPMAEIRDLGALLQRAGWALPVADGATTTAMYRSVTHLMQDLRAMGETNAMMGRLRHATRRSLLSQAETVYQTHFGDENDHIRATFEIITLTGWAPSANQPKPLRPGSAQSRLADALGTDETALKRET
jgi:SAM-dependent methyltransferase